MYVEDIFFIWSHGKSSLKYFMIEFDNINPNINLILIILILASLVVKASIF